MNALNTQFWTDRYSNHETGWDLGAVSPPLKSYIDQLENKELRILIPGAGNAYEAAYLFQLGFKQVWIIDLVQDVLDRFALAHPGFPKEQLICGNFFELHDHFHLILEQTFFCALDPELRDLYVQHMSELLYPGGKLVGVLFDRTFEGGPPFGGSCSEYLARFSPHFASVRMEACINSVAPRAGSELFIQCVK